MEQGKKTSRMQAAQHPGTQQNNDLCWINLNIYLEIWNALLRSSLWLAIDVCFFWSLVLLWSGRTRAQSSLHQLTVENLNDEFNHSSIYRIRSSGEIFAYAIYCSNWFPNGEIKKNKTQNTIIRWLVDFFVIYLIFRVYVFDLCAFICVPFVPIVSSSL